MHHHNLTAGLTIGTVLLIAALICFFFAIFPIPRVRINLIALGLALATAALLLNSVPL